MFPTSRNIDRTFHNALKTSLNSPQRQNATNFDRIDFNHHVDIAVRAIVSPGDRAEHGGMNDTKRFKLDSVPLKAGDGTVPFSHDFPFL